MFPLQGRLGDAIERAGLSCPQCTSCIDQEEMSALDMSYKPETVNDGEGLIQINGYG